MDTNVFIADVKRELSIRNWKYKDLAEATGYKVGVIKQFMSRRYPCDAKIKAAISKVLSLETEQQNDKSSSTN